MKQNLSKTFFRTLARRFSSTCIPSYGGLGLIVLIGLGIRFWNLDLKPLWLDEVITLIFTTGHRYEDIPRETLLPLSDLASALSWKAQSCCAIAASVNTESTHPPLFFCLVHEWLGLLRFSGLSLQSQVRALPALAGSAEIAALYWLNRVAFGHRAGQWAAGLMAVSPFAVYLSQEARHYTLPMLVITLSMIPLVQILQRMTSHQAQNSWRWLGWTALNSLGFYIHYFCFLVTIAQAAVLLGTIVKLRQWRWLCWLSAAAGGFSLSLLPWIPFLLGHAQRSETDWLRFEGGGVLDWLGPIVRLLANGIITVVMLPVEEQPIAIMVLNGLLILAIAGLFAVIMGQQIPRLLRSSGRSGVITIGSVLLVVILEFLVLVYGLHKDLTLAPRYGFVFFPMLCSLAAVSIAECFGAPRRSLRYHLLPWTLVMVSCISAACVVNDVAFLKPFDPQRTAERFLQTSAPTLVVLQSFKGSQDIALGLSMALAVQQIQRTSAPEVLWGFIKSGSSSSLTVVPPIAVPVTVWQVSPIRAPQREQPSVSSLRLLSPTGTQVLACLGQKHAFSEFGIQYWSSQCIPEQSSESTLSH